MSAYENNHYIPQFILRKFSDSLNVYDIIDGSLQTNRWTSKSFAEKKIYPVDLEKEIGYKLEAPFADLLNGKLLFEKPGDKIKITRKELMLMKRFFILETIRTKLMIKETAATSANNEFISQPLNFKENTIDGETAEERWHRTIRAIVETEDPQNIQKHPLCTYESARWTQIFLSGYFAIWDCSESDVDFLISDVGMTSEVEDSSIRTGIETEKKYELVRLIERETNIGKKNALLSMLNAQCSFHENFYMFPLTKNRMIVTINPFFSLHRNKEKMPDISIWPSKIENRRAFAKNEFPKCPLVLGKPLHRDDDEFVYTIQRLNNSDAEYINMLMLDRVEQYMGYAEWSRIKSSVERYIDFHKEIGMEPPKNYGPLISQNQFEQKT